MPADDPVRELALAALDADAEARRLLEPGAASRIAFSVLYRFAVDPGFELGPADARKLAADPAAQADLDRLLRDNAFAYMPRQAAAASGSVERRETEAAILTLTPSKADPGQIYLGVELLDFEATPPRQLFARPDGGPWLRLVLPAFSGSRAQLLLTADIDIAAALADPKTEVCLR